MTDDTLAPTDRPCGDADVLALPLCAGSHGSEFRGETCLVEKSNRIAYCIPEFRERFGAPARFSDDHPSISRVVRAMAIGLNDMRWESDDARTAALDRFSVAILGTKTTDADEEARAWMATDWLVRVYTPAFLRLAGLTTEAQALESLARISDATIARAAQPTIDTARDKSDAARGCGGGCDEGCGGGCAGAARRGAPVERHRITGCDDRGGSARLMATTTSPRPYSVAQADGAYDEAREHAALLHDLAEGEGETFASEFVEPCGVCRLPYHPDCAACVGGGRTAA